MRCIWSACVAIGLLLASVTCYGQEGDARGLDASANSDTDVRTLTGFGGHIRADYFSASKTFDNHHSLPGLTLQPELSPKFADWGAAKVVARISDQDLRRDPPDWQGRLVEGYQDIYLKNVDLRIGKQIIAWGRADGLNPTDLVTPKDFTLLSAKAEDERRIGSPALKANVALASSVLSFAWVPVFNPSTVPIPFPGLHFAEHKRDDGDWTHQGFAMKVDTVTSSVDWSASYYYGLDVLPLIVPVTQTNFVLEHRRIHAFGVDFARSVGRFGVRGEAVFVHTQAGDVNLSPYLFYIIGADRNFTDDLNLNVQVFQRILTDFVDPSSVSDPLLRQATFANAILRQQQDRVQEGMTARLRQTWLNRTWEAEVFGIWNANRNDFYIRPRIGYSFTDRLVGYMGADIFNGPPISFFGSFRTLSGVFVELRAYL
ncbi:MAG TPA: DUF1302 family protein [Nitrospirales bacterium]|jgi:hypothetical protein